MQNSRKIDLHIHSQASDGLLRPSLLASKLKDAGVTHAALTDHDTLSGAEEFIKSAKMLKIKAISGIELSVEHDGEMHLLGYGVDIHNRVLLCLLKKRGDERLQRAEQMVRKLTECGYLIDIRKVRALAGDGAVGRPHIARQLCDAGYAKSADEAFSKFLLPGKPGYVERVKINVKEAILLIHKAGGTVVLAHPKTLKNKDMDFVVRSLSKIGLDGIEALYPGHTKKEVEQYISIAKKYNLIATAGSDYHGTRENEASLGMDVSMWPKIYKDTDELFSLNG